MTIHALWVINKAGGLVFSRSYSGACLSNPTRSIVRPFQTYLHYPRTSS